VQRTAELRINNDVLWQIVCREADQAAKVDPDLSEFFLETVLRRDGLTDTLAVQLAYRLNCLGLTYDFLYSIANEIFSTNREHFLEILNADLIAVRDRDPACHRFIDPLLLFKGFQALQAYRLAHRLWVADRRDLALILQSRVSEVFGVDIHPAARVGKGIMMDHAHGIVIGETAVVGDDVSMLHSVTLGGTGKAEEDRHPKIGNGVMIGAGAKVLGNITVGNCSRIAAGSVLLTDVPPMKTVAGVPARIVGNAGCTQPSITMDQLLSPK
jgi:serine O-acetyltransferase